MQTMCFHEAEQLNPGHRSKTFLQTKLASKSAGSQKHSKMSKLTSGNLMQPSTSSLWKGGGDTEAGLLGGTPNGALVGGESQKDLNSTSVVSGKLATPLL